MRDARTERFYSTIPTAQKAFVEHFYAAHAQKSLDVNGVTWEYLDAGTGPRVLLLLHGGFVAFDMWIHQIVAFEQDYRVLAPTCPALPRATMRAYADALQAILREEGVERLDVMGYSEGGLIAQCFLRDHPAMIDKAVLAHTFYPSPTSRYHRYNFNLFRILPAFLTELIFRRFAKPDKEELQHDSTEWLEWFRCYFQEQTHRLTKDRIVTHIDLMTDFVRNYHFHPDDLSAWDGRLLITVSADDVVLPYFEGMKRLYPNAAYHMFEKGLGAHSIALISPEVFNRRIRQFLEGQ
ncbi:MAG: alpha/beta hydrolase [Anaerolineae bacterium]|nr:alpha/beta hydrolase [Anaerolineae bacterium]